MVLGVVGSSPTSHPKTAEMPSFLFYGDRTLSLVAKDTPRTGTKNTRRYCWLAGLPPNHLGRADGLERTLQRSAKGAT